jgi:hypothetical protein
MAVLQLSTATLLERTATIRSLLKKISHVKDGPVISRQTGSQQFVLGAQDAQDRSSDFRTWRFNLFVKQFCANYFEIWHPSGKDAFALYRAYLNIYRVERAVETEYLCLHTDPQEPASSPSAKYKRGLHFHVCVAGDPFKSAHLALSQPFLSKVLKTPRTLTASLQDAVQMIREEILNPLARNGPQRLAA